MRWAQQDVVDHGSGRDYVSMVARSSEHSFYKLAR